METTAVREIHAAMMLNQSADELARIVEPLRGQGEPAAKSLVSYANSLDGEARTTMFRLLQKHPDKHPVVISLLRRVLEFLEQDRRSPDLSPAQKCDLDWLERYARHIARFILREHKGTGQVTWFDKPMVKRTTQLRRHGTRHEPRYLS